MISPFEAVAVVVTLLAVYLTAREIVWCWPLGLVSVSMYAAIFYEARLYADAGLQVFYFGLSLYGWWSWLRGGEDHGALEVSVASARLRLGLLALGSGFAILLGSALARFTDASLPYLDSALTSFSLVAQFMAARKLIDNWIVWMVVDVLYVGMFIYKDLELTAGLYGAFLVLAAIGFASWRKSLAPSAERAAREAAG